MTEPDSARRTRWTPAGGWAGFDANQALSDAIWQGVSELDCDWHYLNPGGGLSVWEWCADGTWIVIEYRDDRIATVETDRGGGAERYFVQAAAAFGLIADPPVDMSPDADRANPGD
ncbi:hypothetical protein [Pseudomonas sp. CGJS7]|uniref:hypothetical protein n=1 Tax=Pseudomonas sp. CGJS7 TaxID=3109348 RepID=UPI00300B1B32